MNSEKINNKKEKIDEGGQFVDLEQGKIEFREYKINFFNFIIIVSLICWPFIFSLLYLYFLKSLALVLAFILSVVMGFIPFFLSISIGWGIVEIRKIFSDRWFRIYYPRIKQPFKDPKNLERFIKEKESELESLKSYNFKSYIVKIQKRNLASELRLLRNHLHQIEKRRYREKKFSITKG